MRGAIDAHIASMRDRGLRPRTIQRAEEHLHTLLDVEHLGSRTIRVLTPKACGDLYRRAQAGRAVDTHRNGLAVGKAFGVWLAECGWLAANPFAAVKPVGRRRRGKPQLGIDDSRKLLDHCAAHPTDETAVTACCLVLGIRASDLVSRDVRHLDDDGWILRVTESKTEAGRLHHELPDVIRDLLALVVGTRSASAPLFVGYRGKGRRSRFWVRGAVQRVCAAAGVPYVCPHGLRGTQSSLATEAQQTARAVSEALGHASTGITGRAYVRPQAAQNARGRRAFAVLVGGRS